MANVRVEGKSALRRGWLSGTSGQGLDGAGKFSGEEADMQDQNQMDQVSDKQLEQARRVQELNQAIAEMESAAPAAAVGETIEPTVETGQGDFGTFPEFESGAGPKANAPIEISIGSVADNVWMTLSDATLKLVLRPADALEVANRLREAANRITHRQHVEGKGAEAEVIPCVGALVRTPSGVRVVVGYLVTLGMIRQILTSDPLEESPAEPVIVQAFPPAVVEAL
jgi:hypothetical protein